MKRKQRPRIKRPKPWNVVVRRDPCAREIYRAACRFVAAMDQFIFRVNFEIATSRVLRNRVRKENIVIAGDTPEGLQRAQWLHAQAQTVLGWARRHSIVSTPYTEGKAVQARRSMERAAEDIEKHTTQLEARLRREEAMRRLGRSPASNAVEDHRQEGPIWSTVTGKRGRHGQP